MPHEIIHQSPVDHDVHQVRQRNLPCPQTKIHSLRHHLLLPLGEMLNQQRFGHPHHRTFLHLIQIQHLRAASHCPCPYPPSSSHCPSLSFPLLSFSYPFQDHLMPFHLH